MPFPSVAEPLTPRQRIRLAAGIVLVLIVVAIGVGLIADKYFRLSALDDYRAGYEHGLQWRQDGGNAIGCFTAMEAVYGRDLWIDREPGWGEFQVGCEDAASGEAAASWYEMRGRFWNVDGAAGTD